MLDKKRQTVQELQEKLEAAKADLKEEERQLNESRHIIMGKVVLENLEVLGEGEVLNLLNNKLKKRDRKYFPELDSLSTRRATTASAPAPSASPLAASQTT